MGLRRRLATVGLAALFVPILVAQAAVPSLADTTVSTRVDDGDAVASAVHISEIRFASPTASSPAHVVLSRDDVFADSLAGAPLLGRAPLLFTDTDTLSPETRTELQRLRAGATKRLYILGGPVAVSPGVESAARSLGYDVVRLQGETRIETSVAIADQVVSQSPTTQVLLARSHGNANPGSGWVDSVAGGAWAAEQNVPVLLTHTEALHPAVSAWLQRQGITTTRLLGGTVALSDAVGNAVPGAVRHWGEERSGTAAAVARELWGVGDTGRRRFTIVDGVEDRGWAFGLAAAGLAADNNAPVLLSLGEVTPATRRLVATCGDPEVDLTIIGDGTLVSGAVREYLDDLDQYGCGPDRELRRPPTLRNFDSCPELLQWFRTNALERVTAYGLDNWYGPDTFVGPPEPAAAPSSPVQGESDAAGAPPAEDVSGTNVQEAGVDEPDMVKTDGAVAAIVLGNGSVDLVDLTGASPRVADNLPATNDYGLTELLLEGDVLTMLTTNVGFYNGGPVARSSIAPGQPSPRVTTVTRWDVSDPDNAAQLSQFAMDGTYRSARSIDGVARIVIESTPQDLPFTFPEDGSQEAQDRALAHNRQTVKDSELANWLPSWSAGTNPDGALLVGCGDVNEPPAWSGFDAITVVTLDTATDTEPGAATTVMAQGQNVYASHDRLLVTTGRWGEAFEGEQIDSQVSTELHAFDITDAEAIGYAGSGAVNGYVINQFALSEYQGDIRVAATKQPPWSGNGEQQQQSESFVAVLREGASKLTEVGRVGGLGKGEQIQSARFFGDLGVVVTFRQVDPLYLIDLRDGTRPVVTGELKDTGFSRYLHRIDANTLLGVGVDANDDGQILGAQVTLYDISNRATPTRVAKYAVANAQSSVGDDHRSFLYWGTTRDAFVPLQVYDDQGQEQIATVLRVGADQTLTRRGDVSHTDQVGDDAYVPIVRTFIVGSDAYSVSSRGLARHDLNTLATTSFTPFSN